MVASVAISLSRPKRLQHGNQRLSVAVVLVFPLEPKGPVSGVVLSTIQYPNDGTERPVVIGFQRNLWECSVLAALTANP